MSKYDNVEELSLTEKWSADARRAYCTLESMGEEWSVTNEDVDELLKGAIDAHVHGAPDPLIDVGWDMAEIAKYACDAEMSALVFKAHTIPTAATTLFVQNTVNEYAQQKEKKAPLIIGGVTLNSYVGGLNPKAVEMCIKLGGKVVWLPSHDAAHHNRVIGEPGGIELLTPDGKPLPELVEILHMVKEADLVLDLCHSGTRERFIILEEANKIGLKRIMLTHPNWNVNKASADQQAEMAKMGAYVLLHYYTSVPHFNNPNCDPWEMMEIIEKVGVDKVIVATDGGSVINTNPVEIMRVFIKILLAMKVSPEDIKRMIRTNPAKLLGLEE